MTNRTIELFIGGETKDSATVDSRAGGEATATLQWDTTGDGTGQFAARVVLDDGVDAGLATVRAIANEWYQYGGPARENNSPSSAKIESEPTIQPVKTNYAGLDTGVVSAAHKGDASEIYLANLYGPSAVSRYDLNADSVAWTTDPSWLGYAFYTGPALSQNHVVIGAYVYSGESAPVPSDGLSYLMAFDRETGGLSWVHDERASRAYADFNSPPLVNSARVYGSYAQIGQACLDAETGDEIWFYDGFPSGEFFFSSPPTIIDGTYTVGGENEAIYGLDPANGAEKWANQNFTSDAGGVGGNGVIVYPVYTGGQPLVGFDAETGSVLWRTDNYSSVNGKAWSQFQAGALTRPAYRDGTVYCHAYSGGGTSQGTVIAVDAQTGEWRTANENLYPVQSDFNAIDYQSITIVGGDGGVLWVPVLLDSDTEMLFIGLDPGTLDELWRTRTPVEGATTDDELTPAPDGESYLLGGFGSDLVRVLP